MFLVFGTNPEMVDIGIGTAGIVALLGYVVVFVGLVLLMAVIYGMGKAMTSRKQAAKAAPASPSAPVITAEPAPGTAGEVKLYSVSDRDAALIMAIVANKLQKPLNELRFKSIKEVQ